MELVRKMNIMDIIMIDRRRGKVKGKLSQIKARRQREEKAEDGEIQISKR